MRKLPALSFVAAGAAGAIALVASPASAATWTVSNPNSNGSYSATNSGSVVLKDTRTGITVTCSTSTASGTALSGTYASGTGLAKITAASFSGCIGPLGIPYTVTPSGFPWSLNGVSYSGGVTTGNVSGISATLTGTGCSLKVTGSAPGTFSNSPATIKFTGGSGLTITVISGCSGLAATGDPASYTGTYNVNPSGLTVTSP